jgi:hypothetical protein
VLEQSSSRCHSATGDGGDAASRAEAPATGSAGSGSPVSAQPAAITAAKAIVARRRSDRPVRRAGAERTPAASDGAGRGVSFLFPVLEEPY